MDIIPQEVATPLTNAQLAQQILLWIRRYQQEIREQSKSDIGLRRSLLITEIETLCKEQIERKPMAKEEQPTSLPRLIEGQIIHYVAYSGRHLAGMIIGHEGNAADLVIFTNMSNVNGVKNFGMQFHQDIEYSELLKPGTWHWPEKA